MDADRALAAVLEYHAQTKHQPDAYAEGPGFLDWATQPNPFRRYAGARLIELAQVAPAAEPGYDAIFSREAYPAAAPLAGESIAQLFLDSLALSAWKSTGTSRWALRVNASSGNLHPTEAYLVCGPVAGLNERPMVAHYAPKQHALEVRAEFPVELWRQLSADFPPGTCFIGLASVHWREAWKYGRRAFRYCMLDTGHALGAVTIAAAGLGWHARLLDGCGAEELSCLLGTACPQAAEPETAELLLVCMPALPGTVPELPPAALRSCARFDWQGNPNVLSPAHVDWGMESIARLVRKPAGRPGYRPMEVGPRTLPVPPRTVPLRALVRRRRSAVAMDGVTRMDATTFYRMLERTLAVSGRVPCSVLPWSARLNFALLVHRVDGVPPGLYLLLRDAAQREAFERALPRAGAWRKPPGCPEMLPLYALQERDLRASARIIACHQDIAGDGCFSLAMLSEFRAPLQRHGAWLYPRLYWEAGLLGQLLYLEAEAAGFQGTGIGCYFDDVMHDLLGIGGDDWQDLYHFTVGGAVEDTRLTTLPPYGEPA